MNASDYVVYYNIAYEPFLPLNELLFVAVGAGAGLFAFAEEGRRRIAILAISAAFILISTAVALVNWNEQQSLKTELARGHVLDVEYLVNDFTPGGWKTPE